MVKPMFTKNELVNESIKKGLSYDQTNNVLEAAGYGRGYSPFMYSQNWKNLPKNFNRSAQEFGRDMVTFGGMLLKPFSDAEVAAHKAPKGKKMQAVKESFKKSLQNDTYRKMIKYGTIGGTAGSFIPGVGTLAGAGIGLGIGASGGLKEFADNILRPYDTNIDRLASDFKNGRVDFNRMAQGAFNNPLYALLDTAPVHLRVAKGAISKIPSSNNIRALVEAFPSVEHRDMNRQITHSMATSRTAFNDLYQGVLLSETIPFARRRKILEKLITGEGELTKGEEKIYREYLKSLNQAEKMAIDGGILDEGMARSNKAAQYVMYRMPTNNLLHDDIVRLLNGEQVRDIALKELDLHPGLREEITRLGEIGNKLNDEGKIAYVTQKLSSTSDPLGNVKVKDIIGTPKDYWKTKRIIGKQDLDTWASKLDESVKEQLNLITKGLELENTINDLVDKGKLKKLTKEEFESNIPLKDQILFNPQAYKEFVKSKFGSMDDWSVKDALNASNVGAEGSIIISKLYADMLDNAFKKAPNTATRRLMNSFKKAVLANPHWSIQNRVGNFTNHMMNGGTFKDYADLVMNSKDIPKQLRTQTSYGAYLKETEKGVAPMGPLSATKAGINRIVRSIDKFSKGDKGLKGVGSLIGDIYGGTSDIFANPVYKAEAAMEYWDRSANFIRQCKKYAKKHKLNWKDVLKKSNKDSSLFAELNTEVNKALGDYIGRNYAIPSGVYDVLSEAIPFYRFLTQTGRTTIHQLMHYPLAFGGVVSYPSRVATPVSEAVMQAYNLEPEWYKGGLAYSKEPGDTRTIGYEKLPIGALASLPKEFLSSLSPFLTSIPQILNYKKFNRTPKSPELYKAIQERTVADTSKYEPTGWERARFMGSETADLTHAGYRLSHTLAPDVYHTLKGDGYQPGFDTDPFITNPEGFHKLLPSEMIGKWLGIKTGSNYEKRKETKTSKRNKVKQAKWQNTKTKRQQNRKIK